MRSRSAHDAARGREEQGNPRCGCGGSGARTADLARNAGVPALIKHMAGWRSRSAGAVPTRTVSVASALPAGGLETKARRPFVRLAQLASSHGWHQQAIASNTAARQPLRSSTAWGGRGCWASRSGQCPSHRVNGLADQAAAGTGIRTGASRTGRWIRALKAPTPTPIHQTSR